MIRVFQLVRASDGTRTAEVVVTREALAQFLFKDGKVVEGVEPDDLVLCVGEDDGDEKFTFSRAPLMRVDNFVSMFGKSCEGAENE